MFKSLATKECLWQSKQLKQEMVLARLFFVRGIYTWS